MRLIDADDLDILGYLEEFPECETDKGWNATIREVCVYVNLAPIVDAVPVVRCKDCKYHRELNEQERKYLQPDVLICTNAEFIDDGWNSVWSDDFCSYGERKNE